MCECMKVCACAASYGYLNEYGANEPTNVGIIDNLGLVVR